MARLLIVDDEQTLVTLMRFVLEKAGHSVTEAYNGKHALEVMGVEPSKPDIALPELIILDIMMPIMDGHALSIYLAKEPRTAKIPIIIVTAKGNTQTLFQDIHQVAAFFNKPFAPNDLREAVLKVLARPA
jgi:CheY-like chemotaxis protein